MKKFILCAVYTAIMASCAFANFDVNFKKGIKELTNVDIEIQLKKPLQSFKGEYFVIGRTSNGEIFPMIVSQDGKHFIGLSNIMSFSQEDSEMISKEMQQASEAKMKADSKALNRLFKSFKESDFITLTGQGKNLPTHIVVSDPDCPYCRQHLQSVESQLKEANLKFIFAPVHNENAFIKAQLILNASAKASDNEAKLALLRKYYSDTPLSPQEKKTDFRQVQSNTEKIFNSGLIRSVPFVFTLE